MKIKIKIEKKHIFLLGILVFTLAGVLLVNAVVLPGQWHNGDKVWIKSTDNNEKTLQKAIDDKDLTKKPTRLVITHSNEYSWNGNLEKEYVLGDYDVCFLEKISGTGNIGCNVYKNSLDHLFYINFPAVIRQGTSTCRAQCWKFEVA